VREQVAVERVQRGVVDVGREDAFLQVVEVLCPAPLRVRVDQIAFTGVAA
jgi:hypothetical protein